MASSAPTQSEFSCDQCQQAFLLSKTLESHAKDTRHRTYRCNKSGCNKTFIARTALSKHARRAHRADSEDRRTTDKPTTSPSNEDETGSPLASRVEIPRSPVEETGDLAEILGQSDLEKLLKTMQKIVHEYWTGDYESYTKALLDTQQLDAISQQIIALHRWHVEEMLATLGPITTQLPDLMRSGHDQEGRNTSSITMLSNDEVQHARPVSQSDPMVNPLALNVLPEDDPLGQDYQDSSIGLYNELGFPPSAVRGDSAPSGSASRRGTDTRRHKCKVCSFAFQFPKDLRRHEHAHHGEHKREFNCPYCSKAWTRRDNLHRHVRAEHGRSHVEASVEVPASAGNQPGM